MMFFLLRTNLINLIKMKRPEGMEHRERSATQGRRKMITITTRMDSKDPNQCQILNW